MGKHFADLYLPSHSEDELQKVQDGRFVCPRKVFDQGKRLAEMVQIG
jgi:hypothetical protein